MRLQSLLVISTSTVLLKVCVLLVACLYALFYCESLLEKAGLRRVQGPRVSTHARVCAFVITCFNWLPFSQGKRVALFSSIDQSCSSDRMHSSIAIGPVTELFTVRGHENGLIVWFAPFSSTELEFVKKLGIATNCSVAFIKIPSIQLDGDLTTLFVDAVKTLVSVKPEYATLPIVVGGSCASVLPELRAVLDGRLPIHPAVVVAVDPFLGWLSTPNATPSATPLDVVKCKIEELTKGEVFRHFPLQETLRPNCHVASLALPSIVVVANSHGTWTGDTLEVARSWNSSVAHRITTARYDPSLSSSGHMTSEGAFTIIEGSIREAIALHDLKDRRCSLHQESVNLLSRFAPIPRQLLALPRSDSLVAVTNISGEDLHAYASSRSRAIPIPKVLSSSQSSFSSSW